MKLPFSIAVRFLTSSKLQTLFIALGIAVGVSVQVFIGTLITSLQASLLDTTIGNSSQITVLPTESGKRIAEYSPLLAKIEQSDASIKNISPAADAAGFIKVNNNTYPILARGFQMDKAEGIYALSQAMQEGSLPGQDEIILGVDLAKEAGLSVGDTLDVLTPLGQSKQVTLSGIFDLKVQTLNKSWAIAPMALVQNLFQYGDEITSVEMQVSDVFSADTVSQKVASILPNNLKVTNWKEQNAALLSGLNGQSTSSLMIQVFVMVSVVLGIASVLAISVLQKSKQLGILKAMGIKNRTASLIFLFQGLILGILGAVLGVGLGLGLTTAFTTFATNPDGTPIVPLVLTPSFILVSGIIAIVAATVASLIPARRSSRLDPMEVIKNG